MGGAAGFGYSSESLHHFPDGCLFVFGIKPKKGSMKIWAGLRQTCLSDLGVLGAGSNRIQRKAKVHVHKLWRFSSFCVFLFFCLCVPLLAPNMSSGVKRRQRTRAPQWSMQRRRFWCSLCHHEHTGEIALSHTNDYKSIICEVLRTITTTSGGGRIVTFDRDKVLRRCWRRPTRSTIRAKVGCGKVAIKSTVTPAVWTCDGKKVPTRITTESPRKHVVHRCTTAWRVRPACRSVAER